MKNNGLVSIPPLPEELTGVDMPLDSNSRKVLEKRYLRRGQDGQPVESLQEMIWRVAYNVANVKTDKRTPEQVMKKAMAYYKMLAAKDFFPNSPTFTGAGTALGQLSACFVQPLSDDMGKLPTGIFQTLRNAALVQQTGGGNGFAFSRLRPASAFVHTSAGKATGPVGFMRVFNQAFGEVGQGGARKGANMAVLRVDHPDIEEFIDSKLREGDLSNFNISVGITDAFMQAVIRDEEFALRFPDVTAEAYRSFDGTINQAEAAGIPIQVYKTVKARDLFKKIIHNAYRNGEPGLLFIDAMNRANPVPHLYEVESTNPCVTAQTWVQTTEGPRRVSDLIGVPFTALVNGEPCPSDPRGFWVTGFKPVVRLRLSDGRSLRLTENHLIQMVTKMDRDHVETSWVETRSLKPGDKIKLHDHRINVTVP